MGLRVTSMTTRFVCLFVCVFSHVCVACDVHQSTAENDALQMHHDAQQLRPGLFGFELSHNKTTETKSDNMRRAHVCKGAEVRLTKRTLVDSS